MTNHFRELVQELLEHIDNNPLTDEQLEKIEKWIEENKKWLVEKGKNEKMDTLLSQELLQRSQSIWNAYHNLEINHHGEKWSIEEDLLALSNDIGNLNRLVMTRKGRYYDETPYQLEEKLAENIWWLIELANRLNVDIEKEMESFLSEKEQLLKIVNK